MSDSTPDNNHSDSEKATTQAQETNLQDAAIKNEIKTLYYILKKHQQRRLLKKHLQNHLQQSTQGQLEEPLQQLLNEAVKNDPPVFNLKQQLSITLNWLDHRKWFFTFLFFVLPAISIFWYISQYNVPLSILSPAAVSALPLLFAQTIFMLLILTGVMLIPILLLFTPLRKNEKSLIFLYPHSMRITTFWLIGVCGISFICMTILLLQLIFLDHYQTYYLVICFAASTFLLILELHYLIKPTQQNWKFFYFFSKTSLDFKWNTFTVATLQFIIFYFISIKLLPFMPDSIKKSDSLIILSWLGIAIGLGVFQITFAYFIYFLSKHPHPIKSAIKVATLIIIVMHIWPYISAVGPKLIFNLTASGGRSCAQLTWLQERVPSTPLIRGNGYVSHPLYIFLEADGYYHVKLIPGANEAPGISESVYFIARTDVASIQSCPAKSKLEKKA